jgi:hypothetical protein
MHSTCFERQLRPHLHLFRTDLPVGRCAGICEVESGLKLGVLD